MSRTMMPREMDARAFRIAGTTFAYPGQYEYQEARRRRTNDNQRFRHDRPRCLLGPSIGEHRKLKMGYTDIETSTAKVLVAERRGEPHLKTLVPAVSSIVAYGHYQKSSLV